jgi:branched-chain amino acid transport system ATP-binding protein
MTVLENLMVPLAYVGGISGQKAQEEAMRILTSMRLDAKAQTLSGSLSQVELRKMELARAVAAKPKLLVSDEAMAGLAGAEIDEVLELLFELNKMGITIIMIEHIMHAVMKFSQRLVCLDAGKIICQGDPQTIISNPEVQRAYLGD